MVNTTPVIQFGGSCRSDVLRGGSLLVTVCPEIIHLAVDEKRKKRRKKTPWINYFWLMGASQELGAEPSTCGAVRPSLLHVHLHSKRFREQAMSWPLAASQLSRMCLALRIPPVSPRVPCSPSELPC